MEISAGDQNGAMNGGEQSQHRGGRAALDGIESWIPDGGLLPVNPTAGMTAPRTTARPDAHAPSDGARRHVSDNVSRSNSRKDARFRHDATILIEDIPQGTYYHGQMVNYSQSGMGFQSHVEHQPGVPIVFSIENSPYPRCPGVYHGRIKWCRSLSEAMSPYGFGVGVEYVRPGLLSPPRGKPDNGFVSSRPPTPAEHEKATPHVDTPIEAAPEAPENDSRKKKRARTEDHRAHPRRSFDRPVLYATRNRFFKGTIKDISKGGVFIEAPDMIAVGQRLNLAIPSNRNRQGLKLKGEIVRIDPNGLAVRFKSIIKK